MFGELLRKLSIESKGDIKNVILQKSNPILFVRYWRTYLKCKEMDLRITIDTEMGFRSQLGAQRINIDHYICDPHDRCVIESNSSLRITARSQT